MYYTIIAQINQGKNLFSTIYSAVLHRALMTAVQSVVEPCNIAVYYTMRKILSANMGFWIANIERYYTAQQLIEQLWSGCAVIDAC